MKFLKCIKTELLGHFYFSDLEETPFLDQLKLYCLVLTLDWSKQLHFRKLGGCTKLENLMLDALSSTFILLAYTANVMPVNLTRYRCKITTV